MGTKQGLRQTSVLWTDAGIFFKYLLDDKQNQTNTNQLLGIVSTKSYKSPLLE